MRLGIDSYSYHRLLGEIRPGEDDPGRRFADGALEVLAECRRLDVAVASLETCFLPSPGSLDPAALLAAANGLELVLAWGHPHGLELAAREEPLRDLRAWIERAPSLGCRMLRLVAGSPLHRPRDRADLVRTGRALAQACAWADEAGVRLALENHADLNAAQVATLLELAGSPTLGVCFDTANALRVGDDPAAAAGELAPAVCLVHLKDCAPDAGAVPLVGPRSVAYGEGVVDLEAVLGTLTSAGFRGPVCVELGHLGPGEVDEIALVEGCLAWLRRLLADERAAPVTREPRAAAPRP